MWFGYLTKGLSVFDGFIWNHYNIENSPIVDNSVQVIIKDKNDYYWIGTFWGITKWKFNFTPDKAIVTGTNLTSSGKTEIYTASSQGATSFIWTAPIGWNISSGQGTSSITLTAGNNSGNVCVTPWNSNGAGIQVCMSVTANPLPAGSGNETPWNFKTFSVYPNPVSNELIIELRGIQLMEF